MSRSATIKPATVLCLVFCLLAVVAGCDSDVETNTLGDLPTPGVGEVVVDVTDVESGTAVRFMGSTYYFQTGDDWQLDFFELEVVARSDDQDAATGSDSWFHFHFPELDAGRIQLEAPIGSRGRLVNQDVGGCTGGYLEIQTAPPAPVRGTFEVHCLVNTWDRDVYSIEGVFAATPGN